MSFQQWMQEVDELCLRTFSMSIYDLPDMMFHDAYSAGQSPQEFIEEVLPDIDALSRLVFS